MTKAILTLIFFVPFTFLFMWLFFGIMFHNAGTGAVAAALALVAMIIYSIAKGLERRKQHAAAVENLRRTEIEVARTQEDLRKARYQEELQRAAMEAGVRLNPPLL